MPEHNSHQQRVKRLVSQDPEINEKQMKEFRMQLEQTLELLEAKAKQTRRRILIAWLIYLGGSFSCFFYLSNWGNATVNPTAILIRQIILAPIILASLTAAIIGVLLLVLYLIKYGPRLSRARFDLQTSMMLELQQQVKELRESVTRQGK